MTRGLDSGIGEVVEVKVKAFIACIAKISGLDLFSVVNTVFEIV